ncbi:MAG: nucleotidyltransferase family protein [Burkholderiales bacterium]
MSTAASRIAQSAALPIIAMVLAAGRGNRMRPLTDTCPKPLLPLKGKPMMQWTLERLARGGFTRVVVNTAWLGEQISDHFQDRPTIDGKPVRIQYSHEGRDFGDALETAGGISRALPLLGDVFWVAAGDVYVPTFDFAQAAVDQFIARGRLAHLWLVPNPLHNAKGDFGIDDAGVASNAPGPDGLLHTFSTIALYRSEFFTEDVGAPPFGNLHGVSAALAPLLRKRIARGEVGAELYTGAWADVGTPDRLQQLNSSLDDPL